MHAKDMTLETLEYKVMTRLRLAAELHFASTSAFPTNVTDLYPFIGGDAWALWEEQFKEFGEQAGFANSIFEKYIILPSGVSFQIGPAKTDIVLMNAKPVLDERRLTNRWVINKSGTLVYQTLLSEDKVQAALQEAGITMPKPTSTVSARELDAPRREAEQERMKEMEDDIIPGSSTWPFIVSLIALFGAALAVLAVRRK